MQKPPDEDIQSSISPPTVDEARAEDKRPKITSAAKLLKMWEIAVSYLEHLQRTKDIVSNPGVLLAWLEEQTLQVVLAEDYMEEPEVVRRALTVEFHRLQELLDKIGKDDSRAATLWRLADDPWGDPVLPEVLVGEEGGFRDLSPTDEEVVALFQRESATVIMARVLALAHSRMVGTALRLVENYLICVEELPWCFTDLDCDYFDIRDLYDARLALLYDYGRIDFMLFFLRDVPLKEGANFVRRILAKEASARLWMDKAYISLMVFQFFLTTYLTQPLYATYSLINDLFRLCPSVYVDIERTQLEEDVRKMIVPALTAEHLFVLSNAFMRECGPVMRPFCIELCVRAVTTQINDLEYFKSMKDMENIVVGEFCLSNGLLQLGKLLHQYILVWRECILTAFSVYPSPELFNKVVQASIESDKIPTEMDSCKSHRLRVTLTDVFVLADRSSTVDILMDPHSVLNAEILGINPELCDDLAVVLRSPRIKNLQWSLKWPILKKRCIKFMEEEIESTEANTN